MHRQPSWKRWCESWGGGGIVNCSGGAAHWVSCRRVPPPPTIVRAHIDARVARSVASSIDQSIDFRVEPNHSYTCPNYPKSKPPAAASSRTLSGAASRRLPVHDRRLRWPVDMDMVPAVAGSAIRRAGRRAKYLLLETDAGTLILHLGMSGSLRVMPAARRASRTIMSISSSIRD